MVGDNHRSGVLPGQPQRPDDTRTKEQHETQALRGSSSTGRAVDAVHQGICISPGKKTRQRVHLILKPWKRGGLEDFSRTKEDEMTAATFDHQVGKALQFF